MTFGAGTTTLGGTLTASGGFTISSGATVNGAATFTGSLTNNGTLHVGGVGTAGTVTVTGNYTQGSSGTLGIELGGTSAGTYDVLAVSGSATLAGTLALSLINSFTPSIGNSFPIITFTSHTGSFSTVTGETQGLRTLTPAYNSGNVTINVTMAPRLPAEDDLREDPREDEELALFLPRPAAASAGYYVPSLLAEDDAPTLLLQGDRGEAGLMQDGYDDFFLELRGEDALAWRFTQEANAELDLAFGDESGPGQELRSRFRPRLACWP